MQREGTSGYAQASRSAAQRSAPSDPCRYGAWRRDRHRRCELSGNGQCQTSGKAGWHHRDGGAEGGGVAAAAGRLRGRARRRHDARDRATARAGRVPGLDRRRGGEVHQGNGDGAVRLLRARPWRLRHDRDGRAEALRQHHPGERGDQAGGVRPGYFQPFLDNKMHIPLWCIVAADITYR
jgi:hypothetical protein